MFVECSKCGVSAWDEPLLPWNAKLVQDECPNLPMLLCGKCLHQFRVVRNFCSICFDFYTDTAADNQLPTTHTSQPHAVGVTGDDSIGSSAEPSVTKTDVNGAAGPEDKIESGSSESTSGEVIIVAASESQAEETIRSDGVAAEDVVAANTVDEDAVDENGVAASEDAVAVDEDANAVDEDANEEDAVAAIPEVAVAVNAVDAATVAVAVVKPSEKDENRMVRHFLFVYRNRHCDVAFN